MPNLNLQNFAKIKDSDFDVKDITVFAGKPSTGKSYIMKMMYSIDEAINKAESDLDDAKSKVKDEVNKIWDELKHPYYSKEKIKDILKLMRDALNDNKLENNYLNKTKKDKKIPSTHTKIL